MFSQMVPLYFFVDKSTNLWTVKRKITDHLSNQHFFFCQSMSRGEEIIKENILYFAAMFPISSPHFPALPQPPTARPRVGVIMST